MSEGRRPESQAPRASQSIQAATVTPAENSLPPYAAINSRSNMSCVAIPRQPTAMRKKAEGEGMEAEG